MSLRLNLGWPCEWFWPTESSESDSAAICSPGLARHCTATRTTLAKRVGTTGSEAVSFQPGYPKPTDPAKSKLNWDQQNRTDEQNCGVKHTGEYFQRAELNPKKGTHSTCREGRSDNTCPVRFQSWEELVTADCLFPSPFKYDTPPKF